jgi:hypothetical protein
MIEEGAGGEPFDKLRAFGFGGIRDRWNSPEYPGQRMGAWLVLRGGETGRIDD